MKYFKNSTGAQNNNPKDQLKKVALAIAPKSAGKCAIIAMVCIGSSLTFLALPKPHAVVRAATLNTETGTGIEASNRPESRLTPYVPKPLTSRNANSASAKPSEIPEVEKPIDRPLQQSFRWLADADKLKDYTPQSAYGMDMIVKTTILSEKATRNYDWPLTLFLLLLTSGIYFSWAATRRLREAKILAETNLYKHWVDANFPPVPNVLWKGEIYTSQDKGSFATPMVISLDGVIYAGAVSDKTQQFGKPKDDIESAQTEALRTARALTDE